MEFAWWSWRGHGDHFLFPFYMASEHHEEGSPQVCSAGLDSDGQDWNPVLLTCSPAGRKLGELGSTHIHSDISKSFPMVGLLGFET